jgi:hypothetical protein
MNKLAAGCVVSAVLIASSCTAPPPPATEVEALRSQTVPLDPADPLWDRAPAYAAALILQDLVEPRLLEASTTSVEVRALTDGVTIAFRLNWSDATTDDLPGASRFSDACAVQLPRGALPDVPAPQMGEGGRAVEISYWRASWQAEADGRPDTIQALYPGASVDHYPFEAPTPSLDPQSRSQLAMQYAPAIELGHGMEGPRDRAVEDLVAEGPGTLTHDPEQRSRGAGVRTASGWEVVIARPLPEGLDPAGRSQIAFAVWDGHRDEVGARKMRSVWVPLSLAAERERR